jgi:nucleoside-diphosphate-sugar epimerase
VAAAVAKPAGGCVPVNITGGEYLSEAAIGAMVQAHLPALSLEVVADKGENGDGAVGPLDLARARDRLGYRPRTTIAAGIARLVGGA